MYFSKTKFIKEKKRKLNPIKQTKVLFINKVYFVTKPSRNRVKANLLYTQYGPIKNGRIKNQGSDFEKKIKNQP